MLRLESTGSMAVACAVGRQRKPGFPVQAAHSHGTHTTLGARRAKPATDANP